jgi:hypothetical protein
MTDKPISMHIDNEEIFHSCKEQGMHYLFLSVSQAIHLRDNLKDELQKTAFTCDDKDILIFSFPMIKGGTNDR